jgi:uncharacterized RDD family membrane protein YckC
VGTYASFGARLVARLLDGLLLVVPTAVVIILLVAVVPTEERLCTVNGDLERCTVPTGAGVLLILLAILAVVVGYLAYYIVLTGRRGATFGQRAMHIQVVDTYTGATIGLGRATGRYFMSAVSSWPCYLGYLWMLWDDRRQTWHDKVVNSVVVKR